MTQCQALAVNKPKSYPALLRAHFFLCDGQHNLDSDVRLHWTQSIELHTGVRSVSQHKIKVLALKRPCGHCRKSCRRTLQHKTQYISSDSALENIWIQVVVTASTDRAVGPLKFIMANCKPRKCLDLEFCSVGVLCFKLISYHSYTELIGGIEALLQYG